MQGLSKFIKTTLIGGALVVLPAWLAILLLLQLLLKLEIIVRPVSDTLPDNIVHPLAIAVSLLLLICFLVGALIRTNFGMEMKNAVEKILLEKIPGYTTIRGVANQIGDLEGNKGFQPALVEIEEALAPCFIVERHDDDRCTVFIPSAPTPAAGTILIISNARVHPIDVPVTKVFKCVTKWGTGSSELLAALRLSNPSSIQP